MNIAIFHFKFYDYYFQNTSIISLFYLSSQNYIKQILNVYIIKKTLTPKRIRVKGIPFHNGKKVLEKHFPRPSSAFPHMSISEHKHNNCELARDRDLQRFCAVSCDSLDSEDLARAPRTTRRAR